VNYNLTEARRKRERKRKRKRKRGSESADALLKMHDYCLRFLVMP
jgi:hypothetical protein